MCACVRACVRAYVCNVCVSCVCDVYNKISMVYVHVMCFLNVLDFLPYFLELPKMSTCQELVPKPPVNSGILRLYSWNKSH